MRIGVANFYLHVSIVPLEDFMRSFEAKLADDCSDPALFRRLSGLDSPRPYARPSLRLFRITQA
ncbi:MAG: hypothetical protein HRU00_16910 [Myxococcales bacterium]|nr:hypothetical protein [Myxococcales bacterium]